MRQSQGKVFSQKAQIRFAKQSIEEGQNITVQVDNPLLSYLRSRNRHQ